MKNIIWSLLNTILFNGLSTAFIILLGNLILPGELGIYIAVIMVITYVVTLFSIQIQSGIIQKLNDASLAHLRTHYFTSGLFLISVLAVIVILSLYVLSDRILDLFQLDGNSRLLAISLPIIFFRMNREYMGRVLQADLKLRELTIINVLSVLAMIVASLALFILGYGLYGIIGGAYVGDAIAVLWMGFISWKTHRIIFNKEILNVAKDLLIFSSIIYLGTIAVFLDKSIDLFLVNYFLSKDQLAVYNFASRIAFLLLIFGNSISAVTFPMLTKAYSIAPERESEKLYSLSLNFSFLILSNTSLIIIYHVEYLIDLLLPPIYLQMVIPLTVLFIGLVLFSTLASVGSIFTARGIPGYGAALAWIALGINIGLCFILIPRYGIIGAAVSTCASFILRGVLGMALIEFKLKPGYKYIGIIISYILLIIMLLAGRFLIETLIWREVLLVVYGVLGAFLLIGKHEKKYLANIRNEITSSLSDLEA